MNILGHSIQLDLSAGKEELSIHSYFVGAGVTGFVYSTDFNHQILWVLTFLISFVYINTKFSSKSDGDDTQ